MKDDGGGLGRLGGVEGLSGLPLVRGVRPEGEGVRGGGSGKDGLAGLTGGWPPKEITINEMKGVTKRVTANCCNIIEDEPFS